MEHFSSPERLGSSQALAFSLEGILPERTQLLLDPQRGLASLQRLDEEEHASQLCSLSLAPSAARLLLALSLAYPGYCSYRTLFAALYPASRGETQRVWEPEFAIRPIRRATMALGPALQHLGLVVLSLRGRGYWLASANASASRSDAIILDARRAQG